MAFYACKLILNRNPWREPLLKWDIHWTFALATKTIHIVSRHPYEALKMDSRLIKEPKGLGRDQKTKAPSQAYPALSQQSQAV